MSSVERWRLPTDEEWRSLANIFGGYYDWESGKEVGDAAKAYRDLREGGNSGFSALLGGHGKSSFFDDGSYFDGLGVDGSYWSATESGDSHAWSCTFRSDKGKPYRRSHGKEFGFSCRCVQGAPSNGID